MLRKPLKLLIIAMASLTTFASTLAYAAKDVTLAVHSNFTSLDPYDSNDVLSKAVAKSFYQGLFNFNKDMQLVPVLAKSYTVSDDGLTYTIELNQGIKFHDGTDFNAAAVKANFDRVTDPDSRLKRSSMFRSINRTDVIAPYSVQITLNSPNSAFINTLAHPAAGMISPAAMEKYGREIGFNPVGTGPFTLVEWNQTGGLKVQKFNDYWQPGLPKVDTITWLPITENNTRASVIQTGEAHFAFTIPYEQASLLKRNSDLVMVSAPSITQRYISFNLLQKPFDDIRVRQAINYAINKDALIKVAFAGYAKPSVSLISTNIDFAQTYGVWPYDLTKARQLLAEAGYPSGFETELWSPYTHTTAQKVLQFIQQQLAQVGVKVKIQALETGVRVAKVESVQDPAQAEVKMYYTGWSPSTMEADFGLAPLLATASWPPKMYNTAYYSNPVVDKALQDALLTTDRTKQAALYKTAQDAVYADVPWALLVSDELLYVYNKKLSGMYVQMDGSFSFDEIDLND